MDKRTLLAFLLIAVIVILMQPYYRWLTDGQGGPTQPADQGPADTFAVPWSEEKREEPVTGVLPAVSPADWETPERTVRIETRLYEATVSSLGGGSLKSFILKDYEAYDGRPVNLIRPPFEGDNLLIRFDDISGDAVSLGHPFSPVGSFPDVGVIPVDPAGLTLRFETEMAGRTISKSLTFHEDSYLIDVSVDLSAISKEAVSQERFTLSWDRGLPPTEENVRDDTTYFAAHLYQGGEVTKVKKHSVAGTGATAWTAIRSKYFTAALIPKTESIYGKVTRSARRLSPHDAPAGPAYDMAVGFSSKDPGVCSLYLGPLKYSAIKGLHVDLEKTMNLGFSLIRPISKGVLYLLTTMHKVMPNYGVLLIIFSILVKILVYPLTKKSHRSTKEMQAVQPLVMELRQKYKGDPQRLNRATMKLYKEHGVNPLGGCLPTLLQMPLLFALFIVFRTTIELRGAPFALWIDDLSAPDALFPLPFSVPLYGDQVSLLPVLMGVSMFIQMKSMGTQAAGQQKYMSHFMTIFMVLIFNQFPSGLNLYYTLFNLWTILQQKYLIHAAPLVPQPAASKKNK